MEDVRRRAARARLEQLISADPLLQGMYVRTRGDHLILGRNEAFGPEGELEADDRVRLTMRGASIFALSVRRHTGRWERTHFVGTMDDMLDVIRTLMQHIVAPYTHPAPTVEELASPRADAAFEERSARADVKHAREILARAGKGNPPREGDELPPPRRRKK